MLRFPGIAHPVNVVKLGPLTAIDVLRLLQAATICHSYVVEGVKPDIEFPNSFDREIYTENSRKNALKWDEIERLEYSNKTQISSNNIKELNQIFDDRLKNDNAIKKYLSNIDEIKKNREKKTISLNLQKRLDEKKESDNNDDKLNVSINYSEIFPLENNLLKEKIEKDLYLRESLKLFTDLLNLKS